MNFIFFIFGLYIRWELCSVLLFEPIAKAFDYNTINPFYINIFAVFWSVAGILMMYSLIPDSLIIFNPEHFLSKKVSWLIRAIGASWLLLALLQKERSALIIGLLWVFVSILPKILVRLRLVNATYVANLNAKSGHNSEILDVPLA